jgi:aspartate-semialdehyde dehydrogenase
MATEADLPKKILLFGATGVIGEYILQALIDEKASFEKIGIFTSPGTAEKKKETIEALKNQGVHVIVGDVNNEGDVKKAYEGKSS